MESHQKVIKLAVSEALARAGLTDISEVDGIAVTQGPGLEICLRVGLQEAQVSRLAAPVS
jgi:tRNA A37 threonylcarbamoyltransferase TsaD